MPKYQVAYNQTTRVATVQPDGTALPSGSVNVGTYDHPENDPLEYPVNHVTYHHVRELLYKRSAANAANAAMFPNNITDMDRVKIEIYTPPPPVEPASVSLAPATVDLVVGATQQLTATVLPANATNKNVTYASSDATKATVSATGLVTAVAAGATVITVTTVVGAKTATRNVTVTAE